MVFHFSQKQFVILITTLAPRKPNMLPQTTKDCVATVKQGRRAHEEWTSLRAPNTKSATIALVTFSWPLCADLLSPVLFCLVLSCLVVLCLGLSVGNSLWFALVARAFCVRFKTRVQIALPTFLGIANICRTIELSRRRCRLCFLDLLLVRLNRVATICKCALCAANA